MGAAARFWTFSIKKQSPYEKKQNKPPQKVAGWVDFGNNYDGFSIRKDGLGAERVDDSVKYSVRCVLGNPVFDDNGVVEDNEKIAPENKNKPAFDEEKCWGDPNGTFYCE
jgi:hypothetical protein